VSEQKKSLLRPHLHSLQVALSLSLSQKSFSLSSLSYIFCIDSRTFCVFQDTLDPLHIASLCGHVKVSGTHSQTKQKTQTKNNETEKTSIDIYFVHPGYSDTKIQERSICFSFWCKKKSENHSLSLKTSV